MNRARQIVGRESQIVYYSWLSLSDLFSRRRKDDVEHADGAADSPVHPTKALPNFLTMLSARAQPLLLDLGPVIGGNVTFFGEELGCKILVENLFKDVERHVAEGQVDQLPAFLEKRIGQDDGTVDGILCWDLFDHLDRPAAQILARELIRILRPNGVLFALFTMSEAAAARATTYTKYVVVDRRSLQHRPFGSTRGKQRPVENRAIQRMFEPLRITDQFLLKNDLREILFRKPGTPTPQQAGSGPAVAQVKPAGRGPDARGKA